MNGQANLTLERKMDRMKKAQMGDRDPKLRAAFNDILKMFDWSEMIPDPDAMTDNEVVDFLKEQQKSKTECFLDEDFTVYKGKIRGLKPETAIAMKEFGVPVPAAWDDALAEAAKLGIIAGAKPSEGSAVREKPDENPPAAEPSEGNPNGEEAESKKEAAKGNGEKLSVKPLRTRGNGKIARMFAAILPLLEKGVTREEAVKAAVELVPEIDPKTVRVQLYLAMEKVHPSLGRLLERDGKGKDMVYRLK